MNLTKSQGALVQYVLVTKKIKRQISGGLKYYVIIFYIICASVSDIDRRRYGWDNLFRKSSVLKEYGCENLVVSRRIDREIILLAICKCERAKK